MSTFLSEINPITFYPLLGFCLLLVVCFGVIAILAKKAPKALQAAKITAGLLSLGGLIAVIWIMADYYKNSIVPDAYYSGVSTVWLAVSAVGLLAVMGLIAFSFGKKKNLEHTKSIVYAAICIALSFALSYVRLFRLPQGGSVTLCSLLPLMIYSYVFGVRKGVVAALIFGLMQAVSDPWIIHPIQFLLDYPIAFGFIGLTGIFKDNGIFKKIPALQLVLGAIVGCLLRYSAHIFSAIFAFGVYAAEAGYSAVAWAFLYNAFCLVDMALALAAGVIMFLNKGFCRELSRISEPLSSARASVVGTADKTAVTENAEDSFGTSEPTAYENQNDSQGNTVTSDEPSEDNSDNSQSADSEQSPDDKPF